MSEWIACAERMPAIGEQVVVANVNRLKSFDPLGCQKDVGVLNSMGGQKYWSTHGESRAQTVDAFTHWMALQEPAHD